MASIIRDIELAVSAAFAWEAIRDLGAPHARLARGFVVNTVLEAGARHITFGNGLTARELIVDVDDSRRRFAYSIVAGRATHHNASFVVTDAGAGRCRVLWSTDVLPHDLREPFERMIDAGIAAMRHTLEQDFQALAATSAN